ncbi:hypothetical protein MNBD_CHLOROFLEXI01-4470 [hydrothermal vent metagenome]|uniref:Uncharacterized protein n=1 Tax=hydrothermal vent metagenome TaxID=652676 RepID=A0A3B0UKN5_9ZZZZ
MMMSSNDGSTVLHADQEHSGLRTAVFGLLFVTLLLAYFGIRAIIGALNPRDMPDFTFIMACGGSFPIALGTVWLAEKVMKRHWPSGRFVILTSDGVQVQTKEEQPVQLNRVNEMEVLFWTFDLSGWQRGGHERRVPRSWICLAAQISSGKNQAVVYTYSPKNKAQELMDTNDGQLNFHEIFPRELYDNSVRSRLSGPSRPELPAAVLTGKSGQYWLAERRRWQEGFELPLIEFEQFLSHIQAKLL